MAAPSGVEALAPTGVAAYACVVCVLRNEHLRLRRLRGPHLSGLLLGEQPLHLAVQRREQRASLTEPHLDRAALLCARGDEMLHLGALGRELRAMDEHGLLELRHLIRDLRVDQGDPVSRVDPLDDLIEALSAEDHVERRGRAGRVEVHEPLSDRPLADREVVPCRHELAPVHRDVPLDLRKLQVGEVDELIGAAEARVQLD